MLSIGCAVLGCPFVLAVDVDAECLVTAQENVGTFEVLPIGSAG